MNVNLICNQCVGIYTKSGGMNPMDICAHWEYSQKIIPLHSVKNAIDEPQWALVPLGTALLG